MNPSAPNNNPELENLVKEVKKEIMFQIIWNLRHHNITVELSQNLAQDFLSLFPVQTKEELFEKIHSLSEKYPEAKEAYLKFAAPFEEQKRKQVVAAMQAHMKAGNINEVIKLAKGVTK